jgi:hypothetical protein
VKYAVVYHAKLNSSCNGDTYFISEESPWFIMVADGLGSGDKARRAASIPVSLAKSFCQYSDLHRTDNLPKFIVNCHQKLKRTRGAALAGVLLDEENKMLSFCGVGNIRLVLAGSNRKTMCCQPGIVGLQMPRKISVNSICTEQFATGFFFSDGISIRSVLRVAEEPHRPLNYLADEIEMLNGNSDDRTLIVFSFYDR